VDLFNSEIIVRLLRAVNEQLEELCAEKQIMVVVGGSSLALMGLRESTRDIDLVTEIDDSLLAAIIQVANAFQISESWMNNSARFFAPGTAIMDRCSVFLDLSKLRIHFLHTDDLFVMKLYASRGPIDFADLVLLWPLCSFADAKSAVNHYWELYEGAYPDEFLEEYVQRIVDQARLKR
jgi:hypothetical protein